MVIWLRKCSLSNVGSMFLCWILLLLVAIDPTMQAYANHINNKSSRFVEQFLGSKKGDNVMGIHQIKQYLVKYGYLSPSHVKTDSNNDDNFDDELEAAVKKFQVFFHLDVSGVLDSKTLSLMGTPRCGNSDHHHGVPNEQRQHNITKSFYSLYTKKWDTPDLLYFIKPGTRSDVDEQFRRAIHAWDKVSALTFARGELNNANVKFSLVAGEHGDNFPFDGPGKVIGHGFYPPNGEIHIDADETWVVGAVPGGLDIYSTALHEIGHAIGLDHSNVESSIMWPFQSDGAVKDLGNDDIDGVNALYPQ